MTTTIYLTRLITVEAPTGSSAIIPAGVTPNPSARSTTTVHLTKTITVQDTLSTARATPSFINDASSAFTDIRSSTETGMLSSPVSAAISTTQTALTSKTTTALDEAPLNGLPTPSAPVPGSSSGLAGFAYPTPRLHSRRSELEAAMTANNNYNPFKVFIALFGTISLFLLLVVIGWYFWSQHRRKKAGEEKGDRTAELFGREGRARDGNVAQKIVGDETRDGEFVDVDLEAGKVAKENRITRWTFGFHK